MKDPIQKAMKDAYKVGFFSQQKKLETLRRAQRKQKALWPFSLTVLTTCCVVFLLLFLVKGSPHMTETVGSKSIASIEQAYMERWQQFTTVVGSNFDTQARIQYLSASDWLLQQAILEEKNGRLLAELLQHMTFIVGDASTEVEFPEITTFEQLTAQASDLIDKLEKTYGAWNIQKLGENQLPNIEIFYMDFWRIIGKFALFSFFAYLLYSNWRRKRNYFFAIIQVTILLAIIISFMKPSNGQYAMNEQALFEQSVASYKEFMGEWVDVSEAKIVDTARFGEQLSILIDAGDNIYILSNFIYIKERRGYLRERTIWGRDDVLQIFLSSAVYEGDSTGNIFALPANHNIGRIEVENVMTKEIVTLNILTNEAGIYYFSIPVSMQSDDGYFAIHYYDQQGNLLKGEEPF
ncbi:hypothetical protein [Metasolibacillus fluoroglycofenilyticus]|uniref:hypothetical protein n=1 Tax=Metasolibacillus fluoroglycofenilyticus TaxID=1239396 RepID=UPI000D3D2E11|nr:hypothetical protein [Metasolibacillus fluoroglycofenilyticus]